MHIGLSDEIAKEFLNKGTKRVVCNINDKVKFQTAILSSKDVGYFINLNQSLLKELNASFGDNVQVSLEVDNSKYGLPLPIEMEELLIQDIEGNHVFHSLTPGKQRSLLHIIGKPKSSDIRLRKAITVINYLKMTNGKLDFKELNEAFKQNKNQF